MLDLNNYHFETDSIFWFCALAGSGMFFIQFLLTALGANDDADMAEESMLDAGNFKWLTRQGITGFIMMFGLSGLTCLKEFGFPIPLTLVISSIFGLFTLFTVSFIFKMAKKLTSTGTVFSVDDAIGKEATVYQRISHAKPGKISISLHGFVHEIDAITYEAEEIPSFSLVLIIKKLDSRTVVVSKTR